MTRSRMQPEAYQEKQLQKLKNLMPNLIGGAADLAPSTKTYMADMGDFSKDNYAGRNLHLVSGNWQWQQSVMV